MNLPLYTPRLGAEKCTHGIAVLLPSARQPVRLLAGPRLELGIRIGRGALAGGIRPADARGLAAFRTHSVSAKVSRMPGVPIAAGAGGGVPAQSQPAPLPQVER